MGGFFDFKLPDLVVLLGLVLSVLSFRREARRAHDEQLKMHTENTIKLENLSDFHNKQKDLNDKNTEMINELKIQTSTLAEIAKGIDRRLELMEDRNT